MNRHHRRKAKAAGYGSRQNAVRGFLDATVLRNPPAVPTVGVGPIVWGINPTDGRHWYFVCASADADDTFHIDCIKIRDDDQELANQTRADLLLELVSRKPIVIHEFDNEPALAAFCAAMWPSERTKRLLDAVNADYFSRPDL